MSIVNKILVIDCQLAGISGDMIVGALLSLGADTSKVVDAMESARDCVEGCEDLRVEVIDVTRRGINAKKVDVKAVDKFTHRTGAELREGICKISEHLEISKEAESLASNCIETLISAEAKIHGEDIQEVHLHEGGSVDTIADIIGAAVALEDLELLRNTKIYSTPVAVGGGLFKFSHGLVPSPAPATIEILSSRSFPIVGGPIEVELATPTGVSVLVNLVDASSSCYPPMKPSIVGYGGGTRDFKEFPNVLRAVLGEPFEHDLLRDDIMMLETNLDDVTGEVIGGAVNRLMDEGARDVSVIPVLTKKNRVGQIIEVVADRESAERLSRIMMEETGTLGVRMYPCRRYVLARETVPVEVQIGEIKGTVNVKVSKDKKGRVLQAKPEYDDVRRLARKAHQPLHVIMNQVSEIVKQKFFSL